LRLRAPPREPVERLELFPPEPVERLLADRLVPPSLLPLEVDGPLLAADALARLPLDLAALFARPLVLPELDLPDEDLAGLDLLEVDLPLDERPAEERPLLPDDEFVPPLVDPASSAPPQRPERTR
jgi:hypothetical protein